jgi:nitroreductase
MRRFGGRKLCGAAAGAPAIVVRLWATLGALPEEWRDDARALSLDEAVRTRRSIRRYAERAVPDEILDEVLDLARHAPSSMGLDPWCFVVVRDRGTLARLAATKDAHCMPEKREAYPAGFVADAPVVVAVCVDRDRSGRRPLENGVLAAAFLLLAAHARGLAGVYLTAYQPEDAGLAESIATELRLPPHVEPIALLPLGYPGEERPPRQRGPLAQHVHREAFDGQAAR